MARLRSREPTPSAQAATTSGHQRASSNTSNSARQPGRPRGRPKAQSAQPEGAVEEEVELPAEAQSLVAPDSEAVNAGIASASTRASRSTRQHGRLEAVAEEANAFAAAGSESNAAEAGFQDALETQTETGSLALRNLIAQKSELLNTLADLNDDSSTLLRALAPEGVSLEQVAEIVKDAHLPNSKAQLTRRIRSKLATFGESIALYRQDAPFVDVGLVLAALFPDVPSEDLATGPWRPDDLLFKANLAELVFKLMTMSPGSDETLGFLAALDNLFPKPFISSDYAARSSRDSSWAAAIAIRTQYVIAALRSDLPKPDIDLRDTFQTIFFPPPGGAVQFRGWETNAFLDDEGHLYQSCNLQITTLANSLYPRLDGDRNSQAAGVEAFAREHPWNDFLHTIASFAATRNVELTAAINAAGGADQITAKLSRLGPGDARNPGFLGHEAAHQLSTIIEHLENEIGTGGRTSTANQQARMARQPRSANQFDDANQDMNNVFAAGNSVMSDGNLSQAQPKRGGRQGAASGRKRKQAQRLIDPQEGAKRIGFDESQIPVANMGGEPLDPVLSQDVGFQHQAHQVEETDRRRKKAKATARRSTAPAAGARQGEDGGPAYDPSLVSQTVEDGATATSTGKKRRRINVGEREESPPPGTIAPSTNYREVQEEAKRQGAVSQAQRREPQKRVPWTMEEIDQLVFLIRVYGTSWSVLKTKDLQHGNVMERRDQVALKDKARNMKADYISSRQVMPANFQYIPLSKKETDRINSRLGPGWEDEVYGHDSVAYTQPEPEE